MLVRILILLAIFTNIKAQLDFDFEDFDTNDQTNQTTVSNETMKFKIISFRECGNDRKDLIKIKRLFYPKIVTVPGIMEINGTLTVGSKLPDDWDVSVNVKVKTQFGYITVPCPKKCHKANVCSSGLLVEKCSEYLNKMNATSKIGDYCKCGYDKGTIEIPMFKIPLELTQKRQKLLSKYSNSKEVTIEIMLKSTIKQKRFACFRGIFQKTT